MNRPFRLLLIDDDPIDSELTALALSQQNQPYELRTVHTGEDAFELLQRSFAPDLILLDLNMPGMHGFDVLSRLKGDKATRAIPVVILTTSDEHADVQRAYDRQASAFLVKPSQLNDQTVLMEKLLQYWTRTTLTHWPEQPPKREP